MHEYNGNLLKNIMVKKKLTFLEHIDAKIKKATIVVKLIRQMNLFLPRLSFLTVCKCFMRPRLDYGAVVYDQPNLTSKIE